MLDDPIHVMQALAHLARRRLYEQLCRNGETMVGALARDSELSQSAISKQIRILIDCGLVVGRDDGPRTYYRAADNGLKPLTDWLNSLHQRPAFDAHAALEHFRRKAADGAADTAGGDPNDTRAA